MSFDDDRTVEIPVDGTIDLHMFSPKDAVSVVDEYIKVCLDKGIYDLRIIHGKGKGVLRSKVHAFLKKHPKVSDFNLDSGPSGWGATIVRLKSDRLRPDELS
jgi:DNA-nicking Smr family endonuclease